MGSSKYVLQCLLVAELVGADLVPAAAACWMVCWMLNGGQCTANIVVHGIAWQFWRDRVKLGTGQIAHHCKAYIPGIKNIHVSKQVCVDLILFRYMLNGWGHS